MAPCNRLSASSFRLESHDSLTSTNDPIKRAIKNGEPEGLAVSAFKQTAGYGRQGRTWTSPYGGLYTSFLLRPNVSDAQLSTIALVSALAVRAAMLAVIEAETARAALDDNASCAAKVARVTSCDNASCASDAIKVKWPNDVVCKAGKLCGISSEYLSGALCIGIGVNVFEPASAMSVGGKNTPAYLSDFFPKGRKQLDGDYLDDDDDRRVLESLRDHLVGFMGDYYNRWCSEGFSSYVEEFRTHMSMLGDSVEVVTRTGDVIARGVVSGVGDDGVLHVVDDHGELREVASGEAHIL